MAADVIGNVMYEPEQFPGLIIRMEKPKVVLLFFASGKIVCTGAKPKKNKYTGSWKKYLTCSKRKTYSTKHSNFHIQLQCRFNLLFGDNF